MGGGETKEFVEVEEMGLRRLNEVLEVGLIGAAERGEGRDVVPGPD